MAEVSIFGRNRRKILMVIGVTILNVIWSGMTRFENQF